MRPPVITQKQVSTMVANAVDLLPTQSTSTRTQITRPTKSTYDNQIVYITGTIKDILSVQGIAGAYSVHAKPSDVYGCTAEYVPGQGWIGCLGRFLTQDEFSNAIVEEVLPNIGTGAWVLVGDSITGVSTLVWQ